MGTIFSCGIIQTSCHGGCLEQQDAVFKSSLTAPCSFPPLSFVCRFCYLLCFHSQHPLQAIFETTHKLRH